MRSYMLNWRPDLEMRECPMIDENDNNQLMTLLKHMKSQKASKRVQGDKALGPDGFSMAFFRQCWEVIKKEVVAVVQNFYKVIEKRINYFCGLDTQGDGLWN